MICRKCGADIPEGDQVCPACGQGVADAGSVPDSQQPVQDAETAPGKKTKRTVLIAAACVALAAVLAVGAWLLFFRDPPASADKTEEGSDATATATAAATAATDAADREDPLASAMDRAMEVVDCLPDNATDVAMETIGVSGDTEMFTVNGQAVTAEEYLYWLGNVTSYYEMISSYSGEAMDLTQEAQEGVTWDQQLKQAARDNTVLMALVPALAEEYGVEFTDEDLQQVADNRAASIESAGGEEMYAYQLQTMGINDTGALRLEISTALYSKLQEVMLSETAAALTAEDVAAYVQESDLLRAKHILLLTKDMTTGEAYDDAKKAEQKAKADDLLAQLRADPSKFDELMNANSEDTGLANYPDGYLFTAGEMVAEFEDGTRALGFDEISEVIESDYGYHIILRLDPDCDEVRQQLASTRVNETFQTRVDEAQVVESETYEGLTTAGYYEKLKAFQETLVQPEPAAQPSPSTAP